MLKTPNRFISHIKQKAPETIIVTDSLRKCCNIKHFTKRNRTITSILIVSILQCDYDADGEIRPKALCRGTNEYC